MVSRQRVKKLQRRPHPLAPCWTAAVGLYPQLCKKHAKTDWLQPASCAIPHREGLFLRAFSWRKQDIPTRHDTQTTLIKPPNKFDTQPSAAKRLEKENELSSPCRVHPSSGGRNKPTTALDYAKGAKPEPKDTNDANFR